MLDPPFGYTPEATTVCGRDPHALYPQPYVCGPDMYVYNNPLHTLQTVPRGLGGFLRRHSTFLRVLDILLRLRNGEMYTLKLSP